MVDLTFGAILGGVAYFLRVWISIPAFDLDVKDFREVINVLGCRAARMRKQALVALGAIIILVIGGSTVFFKASSFAHDDIIQLAGLAVPTLHSEDACRAEKIYPKPDIILISRNDAYSSPAQTTSDITSFDRVVIVLMIRIGVIGITSYLLYILHSVYFYNTKMQAFYLSRRDAMIVAGELRASAVPFELLPIIMDANLDIGHNQPSLAASMAELITALKPNK